MLTTSQIAITENSGGEQCFPLLREQIPLVWPAIAFYLRSKKNGVHDIYSLDELYAELLATPAMHLWIGWHGGEIEGVLVTQFVSTSKTCTLWVQAVNCDKFKNYMKFHEQVENWAALCGAKDIMFTGSPAWARLLRRYGYKTPKALLQKIVGLRWKN